MRDLEPWMRHALALAERGRGSVEPNPLVGAVVLDSAGSDAGEGWHERYGEAHAEVNALARAGEKARGGTLVVTLEPCCHTGKTPPCTDAVLRAGIRRVVAAMADPFPKVAGGGLKVLRDAGLDVEVGLCEPEARRLNAPYLKLLRTGRPWVHLKWAMTLDGKIATRTGDSKWISGEQSRARVHALRGVVDAVIVGRGTVVADDPLLTARPPGPRVAARVVVTASGDLPDRCQLRATARGAPVIVFTTAGNDSKLAGWAADGCEVVLVKPRPEGPTSGIPLPAGERVASEPKVSEPGEGSGQHPLTRPPSAGDLSPAGRGQQPLPAREGFIDAVLAELGRRRMTNVLVEGGAGLLGAFLDARAADELHVFIAPKIVGGEGLSPVAGAGVVAIADALRLTEFTSEPCGEDAYLHGLLAG